MTVVVTRNVIPRLRGFLASCMLEIMPGVYISPSMTVSVRERVWAVVEEWFYESEGTAVVMVWRSGKETGNTGISTVGVPPVKLVEMGDMIVSVRESGGG